MANKRNLKIEAMAVAMEKAWGQEEADKFRKAYEEAPEWKVRAVKKLFHLGFGMWSEDEFSDVIYMFLVKNTVELSELCTGFGLIGVLYWATESNGFGDVEKAIKTFEKKNPDKKVYHVISNPSPIGLGKDFTLLYVYKNLDEEWKDKAETLYDYTEGYNKFFKRNFKQVWRTDAAYVTGDNPSDFDEFGSVGFTNLGGGLVRVA